MVFFSFVLIHAYFNVKKIINSTLSSGKKKASVLEKNISNSVEENFFQSLLYFELRSLKLQCY